MAALKGVSFVSFGDAPASPFGEKEPPVDQPGDFSRGLRQSGRQLLGTGYGIAGLAGALTGWDAAKQWGLENAQEQFDRADALGVDTDSLENIGSAGDAWRYLKHGAGYVIGQAVPSLVTGGIGSKIGQMGVQQATKELARAGVNNLVREQAVSAAEREAMKQVARAQTRGALTGAALSSYGQEAGSIYPEQIQEGHDDPWRAAGYAVPAAALDVLPEVGLVGKFFGRNANAVARDAGKEVSAWYKRMAVEGLKQAGKEAPTEAAQSVFERLGAYKSLTDEDARRDYLNSAALGALGGGMLGGLGGLARPRRYNLDDKTKTTDLLGGGPLKAPEGPNGDLFSNDQAQLTPFALQPNTAVEQRDNAYYEDELRSLLDRQAQWKTRLLDADARKDTVAFYQAQDMLARVEAGIAQNPVAREFTRAAAAQSGTSIPDQLNLFSTTPPGMSGVQPPAPQLNVGTRLAQNELEWLAANASMPMAVRMQARQELLNRLEEQRRAAYEQDLLAQHQQTMAGLSPQFGLFDYYHAPAAAAAPTETTEEQPTGPMKTSLFDEQGSPTYGADPSDANWQGAARQMWIRAKGRGTAIKKVLAQPDPESAAAFIRTDMLGNDKLSSNTQAALMEVHRVLTGKTVEQWESERAQQNTQPGGQAAQGEVPAGANAAPGEGQAGVGNAPQGDQGRAAPAGPAPVESAPTAGPAQTPTPTEVGAADAVQKPGTAGVLSRAREGVGEAGGERAGVGQGEQGNEAPGTGQGATQAPRDIETVRQELNDTLTQLDALRNKNGEVPKRGPRRAAYDAQAPGLHARADALSTELGKLMEENEKTKSSDNLTPGQDVQTAPVTPLSTVEKAQVAQKAKETVQAALPENASTEYEEQYRDGTDRPKWQALSDTQQQQIEALYERGELTDAKVSEILGEKPTVADYSDLSDYSLPNPVQSAIKKQNYAAALKAAIASRGYSETHIALLSALIKGDSRQVLSVLMNSKELTFAQRALARFLQHLAVQPAVTLNEDKWTRAGTYDMARDLVAIRDVNAFDQQGFARIAKTVLHEYVHAATMHNLSKAYRIFTDGPLNDADKAYMQTTPYKGAVRLFNLFAHLQGEVKAGRLDQLKNMYGMTDPLEFAAEVMSNGKFQDALAGIEYKTTLANKIVTAFKEFVDAVAQMLGIKVESTNTALAEAISATHEVMEDRLGNPEVTPGETSRVGTRPSTEFRGVNAILSDARNKPSAAPIVYDATTIDDLANPKVDVSKPAGLMAHLGAAIRGFGTNGFGVARRLTKSMMMLNMLEETYGKRLPSITSFRDSAKLRGSMVRQIIDKAVPVSDMWSKLTKEQRKLQSMIQSQATLAEAHPDKPFTDAANAHLTVSDNPAETAKNRELWSKLRDVYNDKLDDAGRALYQAELKLNNELRDLQEKHLNSAITETWDEQIKDAKDNGRDEQAATLTAERDAILEKMGKSLSRMKGPYFPLTREGNFVVIGKSQQYLAAEEAVKKAYDALEGARQAAYDKNDVDATNRYGDNVKAKLEGVHAANKALAKLKTDGEHYYVKFFVNESTAKQHATELRASTKLQVRNWQKTEWNRQQSGLDERVVAQLRHAFTRKYGDETGNRVGGALERLFLEALPERSIRKMDIHRIGVAGYEDDMGASFEKHINRMARGIANIATAPQIQDALAAMREESKTSVEENDVEVYNAILNGYSASLNYKDTPLQDMVVNMNYMFQLAWAPAFLLQQVLQNPMLTVPTLAARQGVGWGKAMRAWATAYGEAWKMLETKVDGGTIKTKFNYESLAKNAEERELFRRFHERNQLDTTINHEMDTNDGGYRFRKMMAWGGYPAAVSETLNRASAVLAAYRLERANGKSAQDALDYAEKIVADTHIDYSPENASAAMRAVPLAKILFQFRKFQLGMMYMIAKNMRDAVKHEDPVMRKEARKVLFNVLAMQQIMAGAAGFPLAAPVGLIASMLAKLWPEDDRPDFEIMWRELLADVFGKEVGRAVAKGLPTLLGVDVSSSVGMGDTFSPFRFVQGQKTSRDTAKEYLWNLFGPTASKIGDTLQAYDLFHQGNTAKAVEKLLPRALAWPAKSARYADQGLTTAKGNVIFKPEEFGPAELFATAAGLPLAELNDMYDTKNYVEGYVASRADVRGRLIRELVQNPNDADLKQEQADFNERHPEAKINGSTIAKARAAMQKYQRELGPAHVRISKREKQLAPAIDFAAIP